MPSLVEYLTYYKIKLERDDLDVNTVDQICKKLSAVDARAGVLRNSHIYDVVRTMSKSNGQFSKLATPLYQKWRSILIEAEREKNEAQNNATYLNAVNENSNNHVHEAANAVIPRLPEIQSLDENIKRKVHINNIVVDKPQVNVSTAKEIQPCTITDVKPSNADNIINNIESHDQKKDCPLSDSNAQSESCNAFKSPQSSNSQLSLEFSSSSTPSPTKTKVCEPYAIELKEGMFRAVKSYEDTPPEIKRLKKLLSTVSAEPDDYAESPFKAANTPKSTAKSKKNNDKSSGKKNVKPKIHSVELVKKNLNSLFDNKTPAKSVKVNSPHKSAIKKSKSNSEEKKVKEKPKYSKSENSSNHMLVKKSPEINVDLPIPCDKESFGHKICDKQNVNKIAPSDIAEEFISSKKVKTSVYSGKKSSPGGSSLNSLQNFSLSEFKKNISRMQHSAIYVPYEQLKPGLQHCSASVLHAIEEMNSYLLEHTNELWKSHCQRKYPGTNPELSQTWRDLYWKCKADEEKKLKTLAANISACKMKTSTEKKRIAVIESPVNHKNKRIKLSSESSDDVVKMPSKQSGQSPVNHKNKRIKLSSESSDDVVKMLSKQSLNKTLSLNKIPKELDSSIHRAPSKESASNHKVPSKLTASSNLKTSMKNFSSGFKTSSKDSSSSLKTSSKDSSSSLKTSSKDSPSSLKTSSKDSPSGLKTSSKNSPSGLKTSSKNSPSSLKSSSKNSPSSSLKTLSKDSSSPSLKISLKDSPSSSLKTSLKDSSSSRLKTSLKDSSSNLKNSLMDQSSSSLKTAASREPTSAVKKVAKKANVAPLMSKVKKTVEYLAKHKK